MLGPAAVSMLGHWLDLHADIASGSDTDNPQPTEQSTSNVSGAALERKNGWTLAERPREASPDGMERPLRRGPGCRRVRDDARGYVIEALGPP
jgi:hypothetical protein